MKRRLPHAFSVAAAVGLTAACASGQFTTATIYDTPTAFVRLELDRTVETGHAHSHPLSLTPAQIAAVLGGIIYEEPWAKLPFYDDTSLPHRHPALTEKEIAFFAPLLASALNKATPEEIVTFYESIDLSGTSREVTSGGIFIEGDTLHIVLGNYRSHTHDSADFGAADTIDDRLTPLRALAPQRGLLDFEPRTTLQPSSPGMLATLFRTPRRELIIRYKTVPPRAPVAPSYGDR